MSAYWDVIVDAVLDTVKILPLLFIVYYLIELIEYKYAVKIQNSKWLKGNASPLFGAVIGCVPQCGFSVVSTDLYSRGSLSCGALVAVYIATSDEAIPLMIANPSKIGWLLALIAIKIVFAVAIGYLSMLLFNLIFKKKKATAGEIELEEAHLHEDHEHDQEKASGDELKTETIGHGGCCHHHVETKSYDWLHPLLHCLKISLFILIINLIFGCITDIWIGEEALKNFLNQSIYVQPLLAVLIGLIPNCASSVVLTELFLMGGLSFGSLVAGLCVNAGLGLIMLFKQNKNIKENIFIVAMLIIPSLLLGYLINFFILI